MFSCYKSLKVIMAWSVTVSILPFLGTICSVLTSTAVKQHWHLHFLDSSLYWRFEDVCHVFHGSSESWNPSCVEYICWSMISRQCQVAHCFWVAHGLQVWQVATVVLVILVKYTNLGKLDCSVAHFYLSNTCCDELNTQRPLGTP